MGIMPSQLLLPTMYCQDAEMFGVSTADIMAELCTAPPIISFSRTGRIQSVQISSSNKT